MSSGGSLLPSFLAGVVCSAAMGVALWPSLTAPVERERSTAQLESASLRERILSNDRRIQQLEHLLDTHDASCKQKLSAAVDDANSVASSACSARTRELVANQEAAAAAALAACQEAAAASLPASPEPVTCDPCVAASPERGIESVTVIGGGAAAKWVLRPAADGAPQAGGSDELLISFHGRAGNETVASAERIVHQLGGHMAGPVTGWDAALRSMRSGEVAAFVFATEAGSAGAAEALPLSSQATDGGQSRSSVPTVYEVEVHELTKVEALSPAADRSVLKTLLRPGVGVETPSDGTSPSASHLPLHTGRLDGPTSLFTPAHRPSPSSLHRRESESRPHHRSGRRWWWQPPDLGG